MTTPNNKDVKLTQGATYQCKENSVSVLFDKWMRNRVCSIRFVLVTSVISLAIASCLGTLIFWMLLGLDPNDTSIYGIKFAFAVCVAIEMVNAFILTQVFVRWEMFRKDDRDKEKSMDMLLHAYMIFLVTVIAIPFVSGETLVFKGDLFLNGIITPCMNLAVLYMILASATFWEKK